VRISSVALIKMVMHARSGGIYEIMGLMQGKIDVATRSLVVMDAFALPVQGTETRVNAQNEAYEYMIQFKEASEQVSDLKRHAAAAACTATDSAVAVLTHLQVGRLENVVGWYHSHPGYGCWLSGIDVNTQMTNQQHQDPFVAIVVSLCARRVLLCRSWPCQIDPNRTISAGRVDIGAFRTYPENYKPPSAGPSEYQSIPLSKIEDFGVHANSYYPLQVEHFKSSLDTALLDLLWNKYWVATLSQSPLVVNRGYAAGQVADLAEKLARADGATRGKSQTTAPLKEENAQLARGERVAKLKEEIARREEDAPLAKAARDG